LVGRLLKKRKRKFPESKEKWKKVVDIKGKLNAVESVPFFSSSPSAMLAGYGKCGVEMGVEWYMVVGGGYVYRVWMNEMRLWWISWCQRGLRGQCR